MITYVEPQSYLVRNTYYPQDQNTGISFSDKSIELYARSLSPLSDSIDENVLKRIFDTPLVKRNPVEIERSNEVSATVQQDKGRQNEASLNGPTVIQQSSEGQIVFKPQASQQEVPNAEKFNRLLYSVTNVGINLLRVRFLQYYL